MEMQAMHARYIDLGRMSYAAAYKTQLDHLDEVLTSREAGRAEVGRVLLVEHDPAVVTVTRRAGVAGHVLATPQVLASNGIELVETDRGGDVTYHGPGQLVVYPILDLNVLGLGLHAYMRLLESAVINALQRFSIIGVRDPSATGVWVCGDGSDLASSAKVAAMGVRIRRWISFHGLAINLSCDLRHFGLIVPCGLAGRAVTSVQRLMEQGGKSAQVPSMPELKAVMIDSMEREFSAAIASVQVQRQAGIDTGHGA